MIRVMLVTKNPFQEFEDLERYDTMMCHPNYVSSRIAEYSPHVIVTYGVLEQYQVLLDAPLEIRKRWIHNPDPRNLASRIDETFFANAMQGRFPEEPLISVITPLWHMDSKILDVYRSLTAQSYRNWEWILFDNTPGGCSAFTYMQESARFDSRVKLFSGTAHGVGEAKRLSFGLGTGQVLVELDHDDYLTPGCLQSISEAYATFEDAGFYYTDCAEFNQETGEYLWYPDFAWGYGSYRDEWVNGQYYKVTNYPSINPFTVRHIVGVPNHVRAWRADVYHEIGGHNKEFFLADDYELLVRTFLNTRMVHIKRFGYIQNHHSDGSNAHVQGRAEIQRLVGWIAGAYDGRIRDRFRELGLPEEEFEKTWNIANYEME